MCVTQRAQWTWTRLVVGREVGTSRAAAAWGGSTAYLKNQVKAEVLISCCAVETCYLLNLITNRKTAGSQKVLYVYIAHQEAPTTKQRRHPEAATTIWMKLSSKLEPYYRKVKKNLIPKVIEHAHKICIFDVLNHFWNQILFLSYDQEYSRSIRGILCSIAWTGVVCSLHRRLRSM